jgi:hypothetical protein
MKRRTKVAVTEVTEEQVQKSIDWAIRVERFFIEAEKKLGPLIREGRGLPGYKESKDIRVKEATDRCSDAASNFMETFFTGGVNKE